MRISGPQMQELRNILLEAFSPRGFDEMLLFQLGGRRTDITLANSQRDIILDVIQEFNFRNLVEELLVAARKSNPNDPDLNAFAGHFGAATQIPPEVSSEQELQRTINKSNSFLNPRQWRENMARIENMICQVEVLGSPPCTGTGFLLGSNTVITNYHVIEPVLKKQAIPSDIRVRFDYAMLSDGLTPNPGTIYLMASDWLIAKSEYSDLDTQLEPGEDPGPDKLDYALLRVAGTPGSDPVGGSQNKDINAPARGWIKPPRQDHDFMRYPAMMIMQHPDGKALKLVIDTNAVIKINNTGTRVRYRVNTGPGSSGSPCFDANWNLIALHHAGDPNYSIFHKPTYNQGIPFSIILTELGDTTAELDR